MSLINKPQPATSNIPKTLASISYSGKSPAEYVKKAVGKLLTSPAKAEAFAMNLITIANTNPDIMLCDVKSLISVCLQLDSLKLSAHPAIGHAYVIPFKKKGNAAKGIPDSLIATMLLGYKGLIQLATRTGYYRHINVVPIKDGELVRYDPLNEVIEANLIESPVERENAPTIGYYAFFEYLNGFRKPIYWSKERVIAHADKYSQSFSKDAKRNMVSFADFEAGKVSKSDLWMYKSTWYTDFEGMACKTLLRNLITKWGVMTTEIETAIASDIESEKLEFNMVEVEEAETKNEEKPLEINAKTGEVENLRVEDIEYTVPCPKKDGGKVNEIDCAACKDRSGCPSFD